VRDGVHGNRPLAYNGLDTDFRVNMPDPRLIPVAGLSRVQLTGSKRVSMTAKRFTTINTDSNLRKRRYAQHRLKRIGEGQRQAVHNGLEHVGRTTHIIELPRRSNAKRTAPGGGPVTKAVSCGQRPVAGALTGHVS